MGLDLMSLDVDVLNRLYRAKEKELETAILSGTSWDEVSLRRKALSELSCALHTKLLRQEAPSLNFHHGLRMRSKSVVLYCYICS